MNVTKPEIISIAKSAGDTLSVSPDVILSFIQVESLFNTYAVRYEPDWTYFVRVEVFAKQNMITQLTERMLQGSSFGLMQVMGGVARELGFKDNLLKLTDPAIGVYYGALKLRSLMQKYSDLGDVISSYNQGSPQKENAQYKNQKYVDMVRGALYGKAWT